MKDLLEKWKKLPKAEMERFLKFLAIPLVVIVLMIVVVVLDKPKEVSNDKDPGVSETVDSQKESEELPSKPAVKLQKETVPKIHDLMEAYLKARKTCDYETLSQVYGEKVSKDELEQQKAKFEEEVKFYQNFENLECLTTPGVADGDYVIYARFDIKFRQADTLAPTMIVCYGKTAPDGSCYLVVKTNTEESQIMEEANQSAEVQKIAKEVNKSLQMALKSDENLLAVYHTLMNGEEETAAESVGESNNS